MSDLATDTLVCVEEVIAARPDDIPAGDYFTAEQGIFVAGVEGDYTRMERVRDYFKELGKYLGDVVCRQAIVDGDRMLPATEDIHEALKEVDGRLWKDKANKQALHKKHYKEELEAATRAHYEERRSLEGDYSGECLGKKYRSLDDYKNDNRIKTANWIWRPVVKKLRQSGEYNVDYRLAAISGLLAGILPVRVEVDAIEYIVRKNLFENEELPDDETERRIANLAYAIYVRQRDKTLEEANHREDRVGAQYLANTLRNSKPDW